jgi:hypothetical protein
MSAGVISLRQAFDTISDGIHHARKVAAQGKGKLQGKSCRIIPDARLGSIGLKDVAAMRTTTPAARGCGTSSISNCSPSQYWLSRIASCSLLSGKGHAYHNRF